MRPCTSTSCGAWFSQVCSGRRGPSPSPGRGEDAGARMNLCAPRVDVAAFSASPLLRILAFVMPHLFAYDFPGLVEAGYGRESTVTRMSRKGCSKRVPEGDAIELRGSRKVAQQLRELCSGSRYSRRGWPNLGRFWPALVKSWPTSTKLGRIGPNFGRFGPNSAQICPASIGPRNCGNQPNLTMFGQHRPHSGESAQIGQSLAHIGQFRSRSAQL